VKESHLRARYWRIISFFARVTAHFIVWDILLPYVGLGATSRRTRSARYKRIAVRFRALAIGMGGLMIKVGQFLSVRLDVLPAEVTDELAGLQDEVPAADFSAIREKAEAELGGPLDGLYAWIDEKPLAAASLGQAHRARLRNEEAVAQGFADVVVKVQRPHIERVVDVDLAALRRVGGWLQRYRPVSRRADVRALLDEFASVTLEELDYLAEGRNAEIFRDNFRDNPRVGAPTVIWNLSTRRVLTLEDVSAIRIGDYEAITAAGIERADVAALLADVYRQQILQDGFFHADPHPGNLFVTPLEGLDEEGKPNWRLTFIDFGMIGRIPDSLRAGLRETVIAVGLRDVPRLVQSYKNLGVLLPSADIRQIETAGAQLFDRFWGMSMGELGQVDYEEVMRFGSQFRELLLDLPFQLPQNLLMLGRTVGVLSGMCAGLDPGFNLWTTLAPYATRLVADEGISDWKTWLDEAGKVLGVLFGLPGRTDRLLTTVERGELEVRTPQLERQAMHLERSVNRVAGGVVFGALLIAGAILYPAEPSLARMFMWAAVLPLVWIVFFARGHRPRR
jgi:predicted unusual protein kinase regulating ubiquinone biosynthesis (AarF/ABC1/UbiB family)